MRPNMPGQSYIQQGYLNARVKDLAAISLHLQSRSMIAGKNKAQCSGQHQHCLRRGWEEEEKLGKQDQGRGEGWLQCIAEPHQQLPGVWAVDRAHIFLQTSGRNACHAL